MKNPAKTGLQVLGLIAWATVWIGGGYWLAYLGTRPEKREDDPSTEGQNRQDE